MSRTISNWFQARRLRKAVRNAAPIAIGDLAENTIGRIAGPAIAFSDVLEGPLTGRPCVFYSYSILENVGPYGRNGAFVVIARDSRAVPFMLEETGHRAIVDPAGADISAVFDYETVGLGDDTRLRHVLQQLGYEASPMRALTFMEAAIEIGEVVTVCGAGTREPDPDARAMSGYRELARTRLRIRAAKQSPVIITDDPASI